MKIGVNIKIDVTKIDKNLLFKGAKGTYLDATVFIDPDQKSEFGDHGIVNQSVSKEAREKGDTGNLLGNATVFWQGEGGQKQQQNQLQKPSQSSPASSNFDNFDEDLPF